MFIYFSEFNFSIFTRELLVWIPYAPRGNHLEAVTNRADHLRFTLVIG